MQRILVIKQQEQVIRAKSRNQKMQKSFLHTILPATLVEGLKDARVAPLETLKSVIAGLVVLTIQSVANWIMWKISHLFCDYFLTR